MVDQVIKDTFLNIYKDDYRDSDNYYKILFNNGRALQQRELNQMQTILNKDINAISSFTFKPGAAVIGGGQSCRESRWVRLDTSSTGIALPANPTSLEGGIFQEEVSLIKVRVEKVSLGTESDPSVLLFITYIDDASIESENTVLLTPGRTLSGQDDLSGTNVKITASDTAANPARGKGVLFTVNRGRFYVEDHFVFSESQTIVISRYIVNPKATVGFKVIEDIVRASDNEDLYDNSGPNPNIAAPGADRYRIRLELIKKIDTVATDFFIPIAEVEEGKISIAQVKNNPLAALGDQLALRTFDESGDYSVARTKLTVENYPGDANKFYIVGDRSTMYVRGYRVSVTAPTKLTVDRPRTSEYVKTYINEVSVATYGNYVKIDLLKGAAPISTFGTVNISSSTTDASASIIGTARVRAVEEYDNYHRVFLFDIQMTSPNVFTSARSIGTGDGTSSTFFGRITLGPGNNAELYDRKNNNLFFSLKSIRPKELVDVSYNRQITATDTTDGSGNLTINTSNSWSNTEAWIIVRNDTGAVLSPDIVVSGGAQAATIETGVASTSVTVLAYEQVSFPGISGVRSKTLTETTLSGATSSSVVTLGKADVYELVSVIDTDTGNDVTARYSLDTGQRENFYDRGSIRLRAGQSQPTGPLDITFKYFAHGSGGFFAVSSYKNINYNEIPSFRQSNGEILNLRNVLDFRPVMNDAGTGFTGTGGSINLLPRNNDLITLDISYYVGKKGLVYAHKNGYLGTIWSRPGADSFPECPDHGMIIAKVTVPPYMLDNNDISFKYVDNRRYTMRDIGKIERRLDTLEEVTSLTLLENKTISTDVLDADGLNRFKAGITADNFIDHRLSDINSSDYKASIDAINADLRPTFNTQSIDLAYSADASVNVIRKGDNVYIAYVHTDYKSQEAASREVPVNEFAITKSVGDIKLSPASDNWVDTVNLPAKITESPEAVISTQFGQVYNEWNTNWSGVNVETAGDLQPGSIFDVDVTETESVTDLDVTGVRLTETQKSETVTTVASNTVITESIGNFLMAEHTIQWMRPRIVSFRVTGLRPNSQHFFFFNDISVDQYVSSTPGTGAYIPVGSLATDSPYRQSTPYFGETQYPDSLGGPTSTHLTDANGAISGFFLVPNNNTHRFTTGTQRFAVYDISLPIAGDTLSMAATSYMSAGLIREYEERKVSTRHVTLAVATELSSSSAISVIPGWTPIEPIVNNYEYITNNDYITNEITNNITNEYITNITEITEVTNVTNEITNINETYYPTTEVPIVTEVIKEVPIEVLVDNPIETIVYVPNPVSPTPTPVIEERSCFVKGTLVTMADGSKKKIEEVQLGESLLGQDGSINSVVEFDHPPLRGRDLIGINGMGAFMTPEHPVYTKNGWRSYSAETFARQFPDTFHRSLNVKDLKVGDEILKEDGTWMLVESLEVYSNEADQQVYNFILDGNHTYFANDLLVHNRAGEFGGGNECGTGNDFGGGDVGTCGEGGGGGGGGGGGCVIATHAVASGKFTNREKAVAVVWCERVLHDKWWGEIIRRGYRYLGRQKIADGEAHKYYQDFKDYVDFGRGKKRTLKNGIKFVSYTTRFFVAGLLFAKKDD